MIFGKTRAQRDWDLTSPHQVFVIFPRRLIDGRWAWLQYVTRVWWIDQSANYAGDDSHWRYWEINNA